MILKALKNSTKTILLFSLYAIGMFLIIEVILRLLGYHVLVYKKGNSLHYHQQDSMMGWKLIPGSYQIELPDKTGKTVTITLKEDTGRVTRLSYEPGVKDKVLFIGGSFTMGFGLDDKHTFIWKLQEKFPNLDMRNLGVGAYGSYQSLMVLENELRKKTKPKSVVYGLINHHKYRDVAQSEWLETLSLLNLKVSVPYITLEDENTVTRQKPTSVVKFPYSEESVAILMAQRAYNKILALKRESDAEQVSKLIMKEMHNLCIKQNIKFYVNILAYENDQMDDLKSFFDANGIKFIDCNIPLNSKNTIKNDGHPDKSVQEIWAKRVAEAGIFNP